MSKKHTKQCESCIHARVCYLRANRENYTGVLKMTPCDYYKSESSTLDLPCSIGDEEEVKKVFEDKYNEFKN